MRGAKSANRQTAPDHVRWVLSVALIDDVLALGAGLERSYQVYVRGTLKFRVGQIVYTAFSIDEAVMGFAFPKDERAALVAGDPRKFTMPPESDLRLNWVLATLESLDPTEAREFVVDAWRMVVPKKVSFSLGRWDRFCGSVRCVPLELTRAASVGYPRSTRLGAPSLPTRSPERPVGANTTLWRV